MHQNSRLPAIAAVNFESRQVAIRNGEQFSVEENGTPRSWPKSIWVQPCIDVLHLNWVRRSWLVEAHDMASRAWFEVESFACKVGDLKMRQISITADIIHPFKLDMLADDYHNYVPPGSWDHEDPPLPDREDVVDFASLAHRARDIPRVLGVAMVAVSLHVSKETAAKSGLFGLLGDAPVQMIDVDDNAQLEKFETFYNSNVLDKEKEPKVQKLFDQFKTPEFHAAVGSWKTTADSMLLSELWYYARDFYEISVSEPDEYHPFMKKAREIMFKLRPQIIIRHCDNECYIAGRIPEGFGEDSGISL